ncbi:mobile mystery protein B [Methylobacillus glycogenes]|uniref:mobile mystery protein B n=1 Tax=Methylobacillus glycogenes TaxID=406 RepID=UPI0004704F58|nr:mobile mystery protein B [Methylobacillus glycogenes]
MALNNDHPQGATPLDPDELAGLKFAHVTKRGELDHLEQANIQAGLQWLQRTKRTDILTEDFVRTLHKRLFGDVWRWAGTFRKTEKSIGIDPVKIAVELHHLLGDTQYWIEHETFPPLEIAARFHHKLVYIHPFPNGNGRHARIMADVILTKIYGSPAIDWAGGYDLQSMNERRDIYIQALRAADERDYKLMFSFVGYEQS